MEKNEMKDITKQHFNETANNYDESCDGKFVNLMYQALFNKLDKINQGNFLDLGCGNGNVLAHLADTDLKLYGADLAENMVKETQKKLGDRAQIIVSDAENIKFEDSKFDVLCCNASFHHYTNPDRALSEMRRVMKKGGKLYIGEVYLSNVLNFFTNLFLPLTKSGDYHIYTKDQLVSLLKKHNFDLVSFERTGDKTALYCAKAV